MKRIGVLLILLFALGTGARAESVSAVQQKVTQITVQGSGEVSALPDVVCITVSASMTAPGMMEAQEKVSAIVSETTRRLMELGVLGTDIVTVNYGYNPVYNYEKEERELTGYQASHTLEITCRDVMMLDSVIRAATDSGMTDIYNVSYDVADRSALYAAALELAVRAAEEKAMMMAAASGKTLTDLLSMTENQGYDARYAYKGVAMAEDSALSTGIRSGSVSVTASVTAIYGAQ